MDVRGDVPTEGREHVGGNFRKVHECVTLVDEWLLYLPDDDSGPGSRDSAQPLAHGVVDDPEELGALDDLAELDVEQCDPSPPS